MSYPKKELYPPQAQALSQCSIGIDYPSRSKIMIDLIQGAKTALQLTENQIISRTAVLNHLNRLHDADFIKIDKYRPHPIYSINAKAIPKWVFLALLDHPEAEHKRILDFVPTNYLSNLLFKMDSQKPKPQSIHS